MTMRLHETRAAALRSRYVPALGWRALTPWYEPLVRTLLPLRAAQERLVAAAAIAPGQRILDLGCGAGAVAWCAAEAEGLALLVGIDADGEILERARARRLRGGPPRALSEPRWLRGLGQRLPFTDRSFDCVLTSLFFHHLTTESKREVLREIRRVLRPGGTLHVLDWGRPRRSAGRLGFLVVRLLDGFAPTRDAATGALPALIRRTGFGGVTVVGETDTAFGTLVYLSATAGGPSHKDDRRRR